MIRRIGIVAVVVAACTAALIPAANAAKPDRHPAAGPPPTTFPAGMACPFAVFAEGVENRQTETVFSDGRVLVTGFFRTRVVNLATGKELSLVSQGSVRLTFTETQLHVSISGPIIFFFFPVDAGPGDVSTGRSYYFHGNVDGVVDLATGLGLSFSYSGRADDLCAALAS